MEDDIQLDEPADDVADEQTQSKKTEVIEIVFERLLAGDSWPVDRRLIVDSGLLVEAIDERNARHAPEPKPLSTKNPANFLKDFIRKATCNANWPRSLAGQRVTARQVYGNKQVFEFVAFEEGDTEPFPDRFDPTPNMEVYPFESLSIPVEARKLGRQDEPWLIQVAVSQRLVTMHLAIEARKRGLFVETLSHLQVSVKTQPEIDATFVATVETRPDERSRAYVTVEAKQIGERILEHQVREQIGVAFSSTSALTGPDSIDIVLPMVIKVVKEPNGTRNLIYILQFEAITRTEFNASYSTALHEIPLKPQSACLYEPMPGIAGITFKARKPALPRARPKAKRKNGKEQNL